MSERRRATSIEVASAANVSQATVSRAFAGGRVSPEVKARIFAAAERLNYRPNAVARSLTVGRSHMVALIVTDQTSLIYPELVYELTEQLADRGYSVILFTTSDRRSEAQVMNAIWSHRVDGVISMTDLAEANLLRFVRHGLPVVLYNQRAVAGVSSVSCDHAQAGTRLAGLLAAQEMKHIAVLAGPERSYVSAQFLDGFGAALAGRPTRCIVRRGPYQYAFGASGVTAVIDEIGRVPDSVVCVNDTVAAGCLAQLRLALRRRVPKDVAVVALNGRGPSLWRGYDITAMRQPTELMAKAAVETLIAQVDAPDRPAEQRVFLAGLHRGATAILTGD